MNDVTQILGAMQQGDPEAASELPGKALQLTTFAHEA